MGKSLKKYAITEIRVYEPEDFSLVLNSLQR